MAAELDYLANGTAAMFSVRQTPWHQEGTVLTDAPSFDEGMKIGGLDYDVELRPLTTTMEVSSGDTVEVEVPNSRAVVRTDRVNTSGVLGVVGPSYHVLQNRDAFRVVEPLIDAGLATLETGGSLRGGIDPWMMLKFNVQDPTVREVFNGEVIPFGLISNNHNGARQVTLKLTPVRVVCANTLGFALNDGRDSIKVRHTKNVASLTVEAARNLFHEFEARCHVVAEQYQTLKNVIISEETFRRTVLDVLAELPAAPVGEQKNNIATAAWERATVAAQAKRDRLVFLRDNGDGHKGDGSAWEAYQSVTQSLDHDVDLWKVKGESRATALFDGQLGKMKQKALDSLYRVAVAV